jgi:membrane-bound ClpP family serine protease
MITWIAIVSLIIIGLTLLVIELIFIPGTTLVGVVGLLCVLSGLYLTFDQFGNTIGWVATGATSIFSAGVFIYAFKSGAWSKFALKDSIDSKVNQDITIDVNIGDEGVAASALRPIGKGEFNNKLLEVRSLGELVPSNSRIRIVSIKKKEIIVEPIN